MASSQSKKTEVAIGNTTMSVPTGGVINKLLSGELTFPDEITKVINVQQWARSLIAREKYTEPNPDHLSTQLLLATLTSDNIDEVFSQAGIRQLQKAVPNVPGGTTGPILIDELYVAESDYTVGARCYIIIGCTDLMSGDRIKYTTGAQQVQAQVLAALCLGVWPFKCQITRTDRKGGGDEYLFWCVPPEGD